MPNALIVYAHPEPKSFNGAMKDIAVKTLPQAGYKVRVSDLYAMGWNPVSDRENFDTVKDPDYYKQQVEEQHAFENHGFAEDVWEEIEKLLWCDLLLFQFPLWWFGLPAIMKGWCDRVLAMGPTYGYGRMYDKGVFAGKKAALALTTGGPDTMYSEFGMNGAMLDVLFPINHGILYFVGFTPLEPFVAYQPARLTDEQRGADLERYRQHLLKIDSAKTLDYPGFAAYDEQMILKDKTLVGKHTGR
jgi:NAD(P)H dehydrogenase (quinone)